MNIKHIIMILRNIRELIISDIYDAEALRELEPNKNWPSYAYQCEALSSAIKYLTKLDNFTNSIVYFNSHKEV